MSVLHIATHPDTGALLYRAATVARYDHVRLSARTGGVLGWTGSRRMHEAGVRHVPCRLATADEVKEYRRQQRVATAARLPQRIRAAERLVEQSVRLLQGDAQHLLELTLGVGLGRPLLNTRTPSATIEVFNEWAARSRDNLVRWENELQRARQALARLHAERARREVVS